MVTRRGTEEELLAVQQADAAVTHAETVLETALATSDDPNTDPVVREAKMQLAGAEAARQQLAQPLEDAHRLGVKMLKFGGIGLAAGIGLFFLGGLTETGGLWFFGFLTIVVSGLVMWASTRI